MVVLYFTFVGKGKSKADVPIIGGKSVSKQHIAVRGGGEEVLSSGRACVRSRLECRKLV